MTIFKSRFDGVDIRLSEMDENLSEMKESFDTRLSEMDVNLSEMKESFDTRLSEMDVNFSRRFDNIEDEVKSFRRKITDLETLQYGSRAQQGGYRPQYEELTAPGAASIEPAQSWRRKI